MRKVFSLSLLLTAVLSFGSVKTDIEDKHKKAYGFLATDLDAALEIGLETEQEAHEAGLAYEESNSVFIQAWVYQQRKELGKSFVLYLRAMEILKPSVADEKSARLYSTFCRNTGIILRNHFAYSQAIKYFDEGILISKENSFYTSLCELYHIKSNVLSDTGDKDSALENIDIAMTYASKTENHKTILKVLNDKGLILNSLDRGKDARAVFKEIVNSEFNSSSTYFLGKAWHNIGHSYFSEGNFDQALIAFKKASIIKSKEANPAKEFITLTDMSETFYELGQYDKAEEFGLKASEAYKSVDILPENYRIFELLSSIYFATGEFEESRKNTRIYLSENDKFLTQQEDLLRVKDQYKMELLAAGFFLEVNTSKTESIYTLLITILSSLLTIALVSGAIWQYWMRKSIKKSIDSIRSENLL
ncbi:MAG: tetratricopeptide repeat protein [Cyclobacteriaceae bacterium]